MTPALPLSFLLTVWRAAFLTLLGLAGGRSIGAAQSLDGGLQARRVVGDAIKAVEIDGVKSARGRWEKRLAASRGDRLAELGLATLDRLTYGYADADREYRVLLPVSGELEDPVAIYAEIGLAQGDLTRALVGPAAELLNPALKASERLGIPAATFEALLGLARIAARTSGADSATRLMEHAGAILPAAETPLRAGLRCSMAGLLRGRAGRRADSLVAEGLELARQAGDRRVEARCLVIRGQVAEGDGKPRVAYEYLVRGDELAKSIRDYETFAIAMQWIAYVDATYLGDIRRARETAADAILYGSRVGSPSVVAFAQLSLGSLALRLGDPGAAIRAAHDAERAFRQQNDRVGVANSRVVVGDAEYLAGRLENARRVYREADSLFASLGVNARPGLYLKLSALEREQGNLPEAERLLAEGVRLAQASRLTGFLNTDRRYYEGALALSRGDWPKARNEFLAYREAVGVHAYHYHLDANLRIAEAYAGEGRFDDALAMYTRGELGLDSLRLTLNTRQDALSALQGRRFDFDTDLGIATTVNAFARGGRVADGLMIAEQERSRFLWLALERRRILSGDSLPASAVRRDRLAPTPTDLAALQNGLPNGSALLEFVTGRGREPTTLFVVWRTGASAFTLTDADSLAEPIERFRSGLEGGSAAPALARSLGRLLLDSVLAVLPSEVSHLIISPDGVLHRVPFDALRLTGDRLLVERFSVAVIPSGRLAIAPASGTQPPRRPGVLAFGDPRIAAPDAPPPLPGSADEARTAVRLAGQGETRLGAQATVAELRRLAPRAPTILHLAMHAEVEDAGLLSSAIRLAEAAGSDGFLRAEEIARLQLDGVDLVVLSGCRTSGGVILTGEGIQGLTAPFLEAGARSVVATQWAIGDRSAADFMKKFYAGLKNGLEVSDALRQAKLASIRNQESPSIWAGFTATGDGSVRPLQRNR